MWVLTVNGSLEPRVFRRQDEYWLLPEGDFFCLPELSPFHSEVLIITKFTKLALTYRLRRKFSCSMRSQTHNDNPSLWFVSGINVQV